MSSSVENKFVPGPPSLAYDGSSTDEKGKLCAVADPGTPVEGSVVIVTWNGLELARECLQTLLAYSEHENLEVIVVDNASTDGTPQMIAAEFPSVTVIQNNENLGFGRANNIGIARAKGNYICLINSDVALRSACLSELFKFMDENPSVALTGPQMLDADGRVRRSCMRFPTVWNSFCFALGLPRLFPRLRVFQSYLMDDFDHARTMDVDVLNGWFWVARRNAVEEIGGLDPRFFMYAEDLNWCKRFKERGWRVVFCAGAGAIHYGGGSSRNAPVRFYVEMQRANLQYWRVHHGRAAQLGYVLTLWLHHMVRVAGYSLFWLLRRDRREDSLHKIQRSLACLRFLAGGSGEVIAAE